MKVHLSDAVRGGQLAYAQRVASTVLESRFAEPTAIVAIDPEGDLELQFACTSRALENGLRLYTWNESVIVGFHTGHWHFADWYGEDGDDAHVHDAIELARGLPDERMLLASWYLAGQIVRYSYPESDDPVSSLRTTAAEILDGRRTWRLRRQLRLPLPSFGVTLRSCSGRHDADIDDIRAAGS